MNYFAAVQAGLPGGMELTDILFLAISAVLVNNYILVQFLGCCSFFGVSKKTDTAVGMGMAVIFVMALASIVSWCVQYFILTPLELDYMQTPAFILVIATLVQFVEMFMKKAMPALYQALGIFLPLCLALQSPILIMVIPLSVRLFMAYLPVLAIWLQLLFLHPSVNAWKSLQNAQNVLKASQLHWFPRHCWRCPLWASPV